MQLHTPRKFTAIFQQGETAFGRPIVDGQHPHDFFMKIAVLYDYRIGENTLLSLYAAPMGDPALGQSHIRIGLQRRKTPRQLLVTILKIRPTFRTT